MPDENNQHCTKSHSEFCQHEEYKKKKFSLAKNINVFRIIKRDKISSIQKESIWKRIVKKRKPCLLSAESLI